MTTPEQTIRRESLVLRVLWMLLFLLVWQIVVPLLGILVVAQLLYRLFYGAPSAHFMSFGDSLSQYLAQIGRFAVFHTDEKPWPIADWPQARAADGEPAHVPTTTAAEESPEVSPVETVDAAEPVLNPEQEAAESADVADAAAAPHITEAEQPSEPSQQLKSDEPKP